MPAVAGTLLKLTQLLWVVSNHTAKRPKLRLPTIVIDKPAWRSEPASDTATNKDYKITLDGGENEILIGLLFTDEEGYVTTEDILSVIRVGKIGMLVTLG